MKKSRKRFCAFTVFGQGLHKGMRSIGGKVAPVGGRHVDAVALQQTEDKGVAVEIGRIECDLVSPEGKLVKGLAGICAKLLQSLRL